MPPRFFSQSDPAQRQLGAALAIALLLHILGFLLFTLRWPSQPLSEAAPAFIQFVPATDTDELHDANTAGLQDSAPLFVPTRWSSAANLQTTQLVNDNEPLFTAYDAGLAHQAGDWDINTQAAIAADNNVPQLPLTLRTWPWAKTKRLTTIPDPESLPLEAQIVIKPMGQETSEQQLTITFPELDLQALALVRPLHLVMGTQGSLLLGPPLVTQSSGQSEWDSTLLAYLESPGFYLQLPNGYYLIEVYLR